MSAGRRVRVAAAHGVPVLGLVLMTTAFGAAVTMEPEPSKAVGGFQEVGGCLAMGLILLTSGRCAVAARRAMRARRGGPREVVRPLAAAGRRAAGDSALALLLAIPVLTTAWESGGSLDQVVALCAGLTAAAACGTVLGLLLGSMMIPPEVSVLLAASLGALALWPRTLGWVGGFPLRFPGPEIHPAPLALALVPLLACGVLTSFLRAKRGATT